MVGHGNVNLTCTKVCELMLHVWTDTNQINRPPNMTLLIKMKRLGISRRISGSGDALATVFFHHGTKNSSHTHVQTVIA